MSLKLKFSFVFTFFAVVCLAGVVGLGVFAIWEDKRLSVSDINQIALQTVTGEVRLRVREKIALAQELSLRVRSSDPKEFFHEVSPRAAEELICLTVLNRDEKGYNVEGQFLNQPLLVSRSLSPDFIARVNEKYPPNVESWARHELQLFNRSIPVEGSDSAAAVLTFVLSGKLAGSPSRVILADFTGDALGSALLVSNFTEGFLLYPDGRLFLHPQASETARFATQPFTHPVVEWFKKGQVPLGQAEVNWNGEPYVVAVGETDVRGIYAVVQTRWNALFAPFRPIAEKVCLFGIALICLAAFMGLVSGWRVAARLGRVRKIARALLAGEGDIDIPKWRDEIGHLCQAVEELGARLQERTLVAVPMSEPQSPDRLEAVRTLVHSAPQVESPVFDVASRIVSSGTGGDFIDVYTFGDRLTAIVGDTHSTGVAGAVGLAIVRGSFHSIVSQATLEARRPDEILSALNTALWSIGQGKLAVAACVATLSLETGEGSIACAGHYHPSWLSKAESKSHTLAAEGPLLGATQSTVFRTHELTLGVGDALLLHTAGVLEIDATKGTPEDQGFFQLLEANDEAPLAQRLESVVEKYVTGEAKDSLAFLFIRWKEKRSVIYPNVAEETEVSLWRAEPVAHEKPKLADAPAEPARMAEAKKTEQVSSGINLEEESVQREFFLYEGKEWLDPAAPKAA